MEQYTKYLTKRGTLNMNFKEFILGNEIDFLGNEYYIQIQFETLYDYFKMFSIQTELKFKKEREIILAQYYDYTGPDTIIISNNNYQMMYTFANEKELSSFFDYAYTRTRNNKIDNLLNN